MTKPSILIIEDDPSLIEVIGYNLRREGYDVTTVTDGQEGLELALRSPPALIVLDLMLPSMDGLEVCRRLRSEPKTRGTRIIMLTAKAEESDQLIGFSLGADDYVTKPFSVKVLLERIKVLCRRDVEPVDDLQLESQGVEIDTVRHHVRVGGELVNLTGSEFRLLEGLLRQPGRVYSRSELIDVALGADTLVLERTIDVHVRSLRKKMGDHGNLIETVRGFGYRFRDPTSES